MPSYHPSKVVSVSIDCAYERVYAFALNPANLPRWASGLGQSIRQTGSGWIIDTHAGPVEIEFAPENAYGVLDHLVRLPSGEEFLNPMRVVPNGEGSEVSFTLFQTEAMTDEAFAADAATVERDLQTLKGILES